MQCANNLCFEEISLKEMDITVSGGCVEIKKKSQKEYEGAEINTGTSKTEI